MTNHHPFSMAFKALIYNITEKSRKDFLSIHNANPDEISTIKDGQDELLTSFRFKNNEYVWQKISTELQTNCMDKNPTAASISRIEENLIKSESLSKLCLAAIIISGMEDHAALYHRAWY